MISNLKKVFRKPPSRISIFREVCPNIKLPPSPSTTRWGTWIEAVIYACEHFENLTKVLENFPPNDSASIRNIQDLLKNEELQDQLIDITTYCSFLPRKIKELQQKDLSIKSGFQILTNCENQIKEIPGLLGEAVTKNLTT